MGAAGVEEWKPEEEIEQRVVGSDEMESPRQRDRRSGGRGGHGDGPGPEQRRKRVEVDHGLGGHVERAPCVADDGQPEGLGGVPGVNGLETEAGGRRDGR
jgi:hypothetical protein